MKKTNIVNYLKDLEPNEFEIACQEDVIEILIAHLNKEKEVI